jgi:nicotinamide phosphoribosyltransferase
MQNFSESILFGDSYKLGHYLQYPPETKFISSYIESRGFAHPFKYEPEVVHFGLQMFLHKLQEEITEEKIDYTFELAKQHGLPFNVNGWKAVAKLGYLPLEIQALPEGTVIPIRTPQVQIKNTIPGFHWLTSYVETALLRSVWYPSTVATLSREIKRNIYTFLEKTADDPDAEISFKLHDFGCRGASSYESAKIGGMAHLANFMGTDTVPALIAGREYYHSDMAGFSIPAMEHSTVTAWGHENNGEAEAYHNMTRMSGAMFSIVCDSYDMENAVRNIFGSKLVIDRLNRLNKKLVVRPDSGDPVKVTLQVIEILGEKFGFTENSKGFKVLDPHVGIIQGDGVGLESINAILDNYENNGWSASNIVFGMGGALLQQLNRDSLKYAQKANAIDFGNGWEPINKNPKTDPSKASKAGRIAVIYEDGYKSIPEDTLGYDENKLVTVFKNGDILKTWTLDEVRQNTKI